MQAAPVSVSICKKCGVVAPARGSACDVCNQSLQSMRATAPPLPPDQAWVALRCGFTCNSCRFLAPLDSLDADGAVECAHCGLRQRFEVMSWAPALGFAHSVADLAGPNPEGRNPHPSVWIGSDNPHAYIGDTVTFEQTNSGALAVDASPGHPVCDKCAEPLHVTLTGTGSCQTQCPRCGDRGTFSVSDAARHLYGGILAAISVDHRSDRLKAQATATSAGVMALTCPSCGAPLTLEGKTSIQTCTYCKTSCVVPHRSLSRALSATIAPTIWWVLMRGISPKRAELLREDQKTSATAGAAIKLLRGVAAAKDVGNAPGVYEAPEVKGVNLNQMLFTVVLGLVALFIAFVITRFIDLKF
jgi:hypothetical protein